MIRRIAAVALGAAFIGAALSSPASAMAPPIGYSYYGTYNGVTACQTAGRALLANGYASAEMCTDTPPWGQYPYWSLYIER